jgi:hypothetical protein
MIDDTEERKVTTIEARKWVKDQHGVKRLKLKNVSKQEYAIMCGREPSGFRNGARIKPSTTKGKTL